MIVADQPYTVISVNGQVLAFTFFVCVAVGILFGIVPALRLTKPDMGEALQSSGKGADSQTRSGRFRNCLVMLQFALTLVLMVGSSLAMRGFARLADSSALGYNPHGVLTGGVSLPATRYKTWSAAHQFLKNATERLRWRAVFSATPMLRAPSRWPSLTRLPRYVTGKQSMRRWEI